MFSPARGGWTFFPLIHTFWGRIQLCWLKEVCAEDARKLSVLLELKMDLVQSDIFPPDSHWCRRRDLKQWQFLHQLRDFVQHFSQLRCSRLYFHGPTIVLFYEVFCVLLLVKFAPPIFRRLLSRKTVFLLKIVRSKSAGNHGAFRGQILKLPRSCFHS